MAVERNVSGYTLLVRDLFDLNPDEVIVDRERQRIQRHNERVPEMYRRYFIPPYSLSYLLTKEPEAILAEWDPDGRKKVLRANLDLIKADTLWLDRLMNTVDDSLNRCVGSGDADKLREQYRLNTNPSDFEPPFYDPWHSKGPFWREFEEPIMRILMSQK